MRHRHISNHIRIVLDILDYADLITEDSCMFLFNALDTVDTVPLLTPLSNFASGTFSVGLLRLYTNSNSSIKLKPSTSPRFERN